MPQDADAQLSAKAMNHLADRLTWGNTLANEARNRLSLQDGIISTLLMAQESFSVLPDFKRGGREVLDDSESWLVADVQEFLGAGEERVLVVEDACTKPSDPCVSQLIGRTMAFGDELYHCVGADDFDAMTIRTCIQEASSAYMEIGLMSCVPPSILPSEARSVLSREVLELVAEKTQRIFVSAYDCEGYLIWRRKKRLGSERI